MYIITTAVMNPSPGRIKLGEEGISGSEPLVINVKYLVYGSDYDVLENASIVIENGVIKEVEERRNSEEDYSAYIALPGIINAHVHFLDSIAKEACIGYNLPEYVGSKGIKHVLIRLLGLREINVYRSVIENELLVFSGISDFLEEYSYCTLLKDLFNEYHIVYKPYTRPHNINDLDELVLVANKCGSLGIANPLRLNKWSLNELARISYKYPIAAHVSETKRQERLGSLTYLIDHGVKLNHVVHGVYLEDWEFKLLVENDIVLVTCPRSNLWFQGKLPNYSKAYRLGVKIGVGTDNMGCFSTDIWRDIEIVYSILHSNNPRIKPNHILRDIIKNSLQVMAIEKLSWKIEEGEVANILLLNMGRFNIIKSFDKIGSIIKRASTAISSYRVLGSKVIKVY